ncbi:MAG: transporter substrate-binding domain-containing protein [Verrucomicrobiales bacterium]
MWRFGGLILVLATVLLFAAACAESPSDSPDGSKEPFQYWKQHQDRTRPILKPIREETWAIGLRKDDRELRREVNEFLADYRAHGKFNELADRYMAEPKAAFEELGVPFLFH